MEKQRPGAGWEGQTGLFALDEKRYAQESRKNTLQNSPGGVSVLYNARFKAVKKSNPNATTHLSRVEKRHRRAHPARSSRPPEPPRPRPPPPALHRHRRPHLRHPRPRLVSGQAQVLSHLRCQSHRSAPASIGVESGGHERHRQHLFSVSGNVGEWSGLGSSLRPWDGCFGWDANRTALEAAAASAKTRGHQGKYSHDLLRLGDGGRVSLSDRLGSRAQPARTPPSLPQSGRKGLLTSMSCLFRGGIVNRSYGAHKTLYTSLFLLRKFGPTYHYMSPVMVGVATLFPLPRRQV